MAQKWAKFAILKQKLGNLVSGKWPFLEEIWIENDSNQAKSYPESIIDNILAIPKVILFPNAKLVEFYRNQISQF